MYSINKMSCSSERRPFIVKYMVSEKNLCLIEKEGYEYIVGMKMRGLKIVKDLVLSIPGRYRKIEGNLKVKETLV